MNLLILVGIMETDLSLLRVGKILFQQRQNKVWHDLMDYPSVEQHDQRMLVDRDVSWHEVEHSWEKSDWESRVVCVFPSIKQVLIQTSVSPQKKHFIYLAVTKHTIENSFWIFFSNGINMTLFKKWLKVGISKINKREFLRLEKGFSCTEQRLELVQVEIRVNSLD